MSNDEPQVPANPVIAGFWRRAGAFVADFLLLVAVGLLLGVAFAPQFAQMGPWGKLVGFGIALVYFGVLNSRLGAGQTLGKRLLGIRVAGEQGNALSLPRAFVRFLPVGIPWFLNGARLDPAVLESAWMGVLSLLVFGVSLCSLYLVIFNRRTRQTLHDRIVKSYVVRKTSEGAFVREPIPKRHLAVCGVVMIVAASAPVLMSFLAQATPFAALPFVEGETLHYKPAGAAPAPVSPPAGTPA